MTIKTRIDLMKTSMSRLIENIKKAPTVSVWIIFLIFSLTVLSGAWKGSILRDTTQIKATQNHLLNDPTSDVFWGLEVVPPELGVDNKPAFLLKLIEIYVSQDDALFPDTFCVDEVIYYENAFLDRREYSLSVEQILSLEDAPICVPLENTNLDITIDGKPYWLYRFVAEEKTPIEFPPAFSKPISYYYPYDGFNTDLTFQARYRVVGKNEEIRSGLVSPRLNVFNFLLESNWDIKAEALDYKIDQVPSRYFSLMNLDRLDKYNVLILNYERPLVTRLVYPIILLSMLVFIIMLSYIDDIGTFIQGSAGVLFGMFGVRSVLIDIPISQGRTITDVVFILLYLAFALAVTVFLFKQWNRNKKV